MEEEPELPTTVPPEQAHTDEALAFKNAMVLSNSETCLLLEKIEATRKEQGLPLNSHFAKSLDYTKRVCLIRNEHTVEAIRRMLLYDHHLTEYEAGQMMNLSPENEEEATILIPSLKDEARFKENDVFMIITDFQQLKQFE